jgi:multidrug resistance protein, MATE family
VQSNRLFSANTSPRERHTQVLKLAAPIILANLSVPLLGAVDTAVMGHLPHAHYLGAVAIGATIMQFIYWGFGFLRMGTTGLTAQAFGANQPAEVRANFQRAAILGLIIGLLLWALQYPIITLSLHLFEASATVEELAHAYFQIRIWSAPAVLINYCLIGWFIGIHNTRLTFILQVWMNLVNILLDLIFVLGFGWGVEGVAAATVIAEVSAALLGIILYRREVSRIGGTQEPVKLIDTAKLKRMIAINLDIFIRTFCLIFAFAFFTAEAAKFGDATLAANAVLLQFLHFLSFGLDGFAQAAEALVGQALGAKDRRMFKIAVRTSTIWAVGISGAYALVYWITGPLIIDLLTDIESVRLAAKEVVIWLIVLPMIAVWPYMLDGIFIGATRSADMRNGMMISLAIFVAALFVFKAEFGYHGLWLALTIFMAARGITLGFVYPKLERSIGN